MKRQHRAHEVIHERSEVSNLLARQHENKAVCARATGRKEAQACRCLSTLSKGSPALRP